MCATNENALASPDVVSGDLNDSNFRDIPIEAIEDQQHYPISHAQNRLWIQDHRIASDITYLVPVSYEVPDEIDIEDISRGFNYLLERHHSLRTIFRTVNGIPRQQIIEVSSFIFNIQVTSRHHTDVRYRTEINRPFDLSTAPLIRAQLVRIPGQGKRLNVTIHHILTDEWSMKIFYDDLVEYLIENVRKEPLKIQYKDFSVWQNSMIERGVFNHSKRFWADVFSKEIPLIKLGRESISQPFDGTGYSCEIHLPGWVKQQFRDLSRTHRCTMFTVVLASLKTFIARYTGQTDVIIGTSIFGRDHYDLGDQMGFYVNLLPLRAEVDLQENFSTLLVAMKANVFEAFQHQFYPFDLLHDQVHDSLGDHSTSPFNIFLTLLEDSSHLPMPSAQPEVIEETALKFEHHYTFSEYADGLVLTVSYAKGLFRPSQIQRMLRHYVTLVSAVAMDPSRPLKDLSYVSVEERALLLGDFQGSTVSYPITTIHQLFHEQVRKTPDQIAVVYDDRMLSYQELDLRSNRFSHYLQSAGVVRGDRIGLMMDRSERMLIAILGILKCGACYVPIDPDYPETRKRFMMEDSALRLLVVDPGTAKNDIPDQLHYQGCETGNYSDAPTNSGATSTELSYIIYTSGTTGQPKGVMIEHQSVINTVLSQQMNIVAADRMMQFASLSFDASVFEIFTAFLKGLTLVVMPSGMANFGIELTRFMKRSSITITLLPPSLIRNIDPKELTFLRALIMGGEATDKTVATILSRSMECYNAYGPTEGTVCISVEHIQENEKSEISSVPIGKPLNNTKAYILNEQQALLGIGQVGELFISGAGLARGYYNQKELTDDKFLPNPFEKHTRMYRTGDLCRWLDDGRLEFIGRIDGQLKVRGYRIEPAEVEYSIQQLPGINGSLVTAVLLSGQHELVCYYTGKQREVAEFRAALTERLPVYMLPSYFIYVEKFPLTVNGKIDRNRLPSVVVRTSSYIAPQTKIEKALVSIWEEILEHSPIGVADNFFDLGGHSLKGTRMMMAVFRDLHLELSLRTLFKFPMIRQLAEHLINLHQPLESTLIPSSEDQRHYPLSHAQRRLWVLDQVDSQHLWYTIPMEYKVEEPLEPAQVRSALDELLHRHDALRTFFVLVEGEPRQCVLESAPIDEVFTFVDLSKSLDAINKLAVLRNKNLVHQFDLSNAPLLCVTLVKLSEVRYLVLLNIHHIISDGWSMPVFFQDMKQILTGTQLNRPRIQYKDYTLWQQQLLRSSIMEHHRQYWIGCLSSHRDPLAIVTDYPRPQIFDSRGGSMSIILSSNVIEGLQHLSQRSEGGLFMTLHAVLKLFLFQYTGQTDIIIGSAVSGRDHADLQDQIGFYVNMIALRSDSISPEDSFSSFLLKINEQTLRAYDHQEFPFDLLIEELELPRQLSRSPLFEVVISLDQVSRQAVVGKQDELKELPVNAKFDLAFDFSEYADGLVLTISYSKGLFQSSRIQRMLRHYATLVSAVVMDPSRPLKDISYVSTEERALLLGGFQGPAVFYPNTPIGQLFHEQVLKTPDHIAVVCEDRMLSYMELDLRSNRFSHYLQSVGVVRGDRVGLMMDRSERMLIVLLGILKCGACYVPIDPDYPDSRKRFMMEDSALRLLVVDAGTAKNDMPGQLPYEGYEIANYSDAPTNSGVVSSDLVYIIYTSGTTGQPKGVMIEHQSVVNLSCWLGDMMYKKSSTPLRAMLTAAINFDASVQQLFAPVLFGSSVIISTTAMRDDVGEYVRCIRYFDVDVLDITPARLGILLQAVEEQNTLLNVSWTLVGGDKLSAIDIGRYYRRCHETLLINVYGPTEATVDSTYEIVSQQESKGQIIGKPIPNAKAYLLNRSQQLVGLGQTGELFIGGIGVARGYNGHARLTEERFIANPFCDGERLYRTGDECRWLDDGRLEFLGRLDGQMKIRGYRIEPAEVEFAMRQVEGVEHAVVSKEGETDAYLVAHYTGTELNQTFLRFSLKHLLPEYMIPTNFIYVHHIPLTLNGKVDYHLLPPMRMPSDLYAQPLTALQQDLIKIWEEVLERHPIGIRDNFFDLGGHSLKAMKLVFRIKRELGLNVTLMNILQNGTVEEISKSVANPSVASTMSMALNEGGAHLENIFMIPPIIGSPIVFTSLAASLKEKFQCYGLIQPGLMNESVTIASIEMLADLFLEEIIRRQPNGKFNILGYSMGCLTAFEIVKLLERRGSECTMIMIDRPLISYGVALNENEMEALFRQNIGGFDGKVNPDLMEALRNIFHQNMKISEAYRPSGLVLSPTYLAESDMSYDIKSMSGWYPFLGGLISNKRISGDHYSIVNHVDLPNLVLEAMRADV